jgi:uncharacterized protein YcsI (UPF0317 family)
MAGATMIKAAEALTPLELRRQIRSGGHKTTTAGRALGHLQGNLVILPADWALDFAVFCQRNPKPCPLLAISDRGDPVLPSLGEDLDLRTDLPKYRIWENGELRAEVHEISDVWQADFVAFVIGCSFSFEEALMENGLGVRHIEEGSEGSMYITNLKTKKAGAFEGSLVVSMRPYREADAIRAVEITGRFPLAHGAPVHLGDPSKIGVADLSAPDFGVAVTIKADEIPVFWACGVTPQVVVRNAKPPICITHAPGHMVVTDLPSKGASAA